MQKVLIVEDDVMIADMIEDILIDGGYAVSGIARTVEEAVALGRSRRPDLAVIDVRLADGGLGTEIPVRWAALGLDRIGILYATGNTAFLMKSGAAGEGCLAKPYSVADLQRSLKIVTAIVATGTASPPFPGGFQLMPAATRSGGDET